MQLQPPGAGAVNVGSLRPPGAAAVPGPLSPPGRTFVPAVEVYAEEPERATAAGLGQALPAGVRAGDSLLVIKATSTTDHARASSPKPSLLAPIPVDESSRLSPRPSRVGFSDSVEVVPDTATDVAGPRPPLAKRPSPTPLTAFSGVPAAPSMLRVPTVPGALSPTASTRTTALASAGVTMTPLGMLAPTPLAWAATPSTAAMAEPSAALTALASRAVATVPSVVLEEPESEEQADRPSVIEEAPESDEDVEADDAAVAGVKPRPAEASASVTTALQTALEIEEEVASLRAELLEETEQAEAASVAGPRARVSGHATPPGYSLRQYEVGTHESLTCTRVKC